MMTGHGDEGLNEGKICRMLGPEGYDNFCKGRAEGQAQFVELILTPVRRLGTLFMMFIAIFQKPK